MTQPRPPAREQMLDAVKQVMGQVADQRKSAIAEKRAELERRRHRERRAPLLAALAAVGLAVTILVMLPRIQRPYEPPAGGEAERQARQAVEFAASLVEQYRGTTGRLPRSLEELGVPLPGVQYALDRGGYTLTVVADGTPITHRGSATAPAAPGPAPPSR